MKSLYESYVTLNLEEQNFSELEEFFVENVDAIADKVSDILDENDMTLDDFSEDEYDGLLDLAMESVILDEGIGSVVKTAFTKLGGFLAGRPLTTEPKPITATQPTLPKLMRPNPNRVSNQPPQIMRPNPNRVFPPAVTQAKQQIKRRVQHGTHAKKAFLAQLPKDDLASLDGYKKIISRSHKDGSVRHYGIDIYGNKTHLGTSGRTEDGSWGHEYHPD
jgi:hypothetical protein